MTIKLHPSLAVHAGEWLRTELVEPHGLNVTETAEKLGVTRQAMSGLLNGRAGLSAEMAIRFEKAFGVRAETLMRMQSAFELAQARVREKDIRVTRIAASRPNAAVDRLIRTAAIRRNRSRDRDCRG